MGCLRVSKAVSLFLLTGSIFLFGQQNGKLKTKVNPGRAGVFVDGKYLGPAANFRIGRTYQVASGEHELRVAEPRYEDLVKKINIEPGKTLVVSETLKKLAPAHPPFGLLRVRGFEKFSAVYVNDKFMGHEGEFNNCTQGLKINPGDYTVRVVGPDGNTAKEEKVAIKQEQVTLISK